MPEPDPMPEPEPDPDPNPNPNPDFQIIIDSNNGNNGANAEMKVSGSWTASGGPSQYGTGYWWQSTQPKSDVAEFAFYLDEPMQLTVDAWWTQGQNRSSSAAFIIWNASLNLLDIVYTNQKAGGGQWNELGTYQFQAGWNYVDLSIWGNPGSVVVADAVRVRAN